MSRQLTQKFNLGYPKKQAKDLPRSMRQGKMADAQHTLAKEYGFASWAKLKSHVEALGLTPAEALRAAVCDNDAPRVRKILDRYPELRGLTGSSFTLVWSVTQLTSHVLPHHPSMTARSAANPCRSSAKQIEPGWLCH
jgi:hypothetical protein